MNNEIRVGQAVLISLRRSGVTRVNQLKDRREKVLAEMALVNRDKPSFRKVSSKQVAYATERMRQMLLDPEQGYGKQLLHLLVDEIRVDSKRPTDTPVPARNFMLAV